MNVIANSRTFAHGDECACSRPCFGCQAASRNVLEQFVHGSTGCSLHSLTIDERSDMPAEWFSAYAFAMVRRGYLIRERTDRSGRRVAVDVVGPGCCFPIDRGADGQHSGLSGYAVTRALVCFCEPAVLLDAIEHGGATAAQLHGLNSEAMARMERLADARGRHDNAAKLSALLCAMADSLRPGSSERDRIPGGFIQRDLAALLSIRHESVCRSMRDFMRAGLIRKDGDEIVLSDRQRLETM